MIVKRGDGFYVLSLGRDKVLGGPYQTRAKAIKVFNARVADHSTNVPEARPRRTLH